MKTTSAEAAALAEARHEIPFPDWEGVPAGVGRESISIVSDLLDRFPARLLKVAGARDKAHRVPPRTMAYVATKRNSTAGAMHFVRASLSEKRLLESGQRGIAVGHFRGHVDTWQDSLAHVATHEFVHGLDANVGDKLTQLFRREYHAAVAGMDGPEIAAWRTANLGAYARTNYSEGVAEVLAEALIEGDNASPFARDLLAKALTLLEEEL